MRGTPVGWPMGWLAGVPRLSGYLFARLSIAAGRVNFLKSTYLPSSGSKQPVLARPEITRKGGFSVR